MLPDLSPALVREAAERIRPLARRTPVFTSASVNRAAGAEVFFKCENLQRGGSFKIRGASNFILSLSKPELARGVVAFSSGNHAQAVAVAAQHVGAKATIVMPSDAPRSKIEATRDYGAEIVTYDRLRENREAIAEQILNETGAILVPPFDHPLIMAGQGTAALELIEDEPELDALIAPVGGGGLLAGCATIAKELSPQVRVFGAEPEGANDTYLSFQAGKRIEIPAQNTIADGLRSPAPGKLTFPVIRRHVEGIVLVTEEEIRATVKFVLLRMKVLTEPSGAVSAAAVLHQKLPAGLQRIGVIVSGGNVDFEQLATY